LLNFAEGNDRTGEASGDEPRRAVHFTR
jgi:hypothetical protein